MSPRHPCPVCGKETILLAGILLREHDAQYRTRAFHVCWRDRLHRRLGSQEWMPLPPKSGQSSNKVA